jgi:hypothetical protein
MKNKRDRREKEMERTRRDKCTGRKKRRENRKALSAHLALSVEGLDRTTQPAVKP